MMGDMAAILAYLAAAVVAVWGVAHAVPTRQVLAGFAPITADNRRIVLQEWLAEAFTMWGIAAMVIAATAAGGPVTDVRAWVYRVAAALLVALGALTALTGARTPVAWFKVCPAVMAIAAVLLLVASAG
jgi:hypothetical protein